MAKFIGILSLMLSLFATSNAQQSSTNKILSRLELVAGPSLSKNSGYLSDYDNKLGYSFGVGYYQNFSKSFSLNVRSLYEMKGSSATYSYGLRKMDGTTTEMTDRYTTQFNYLTFYLLPTFRLGPQKNIYISAGGYYSFLQKLSVNRYSTNRNTGEFISEYTNTDKNYFDPGFDAGVSFLIGYSFKINNKSQLMLQAFSNLGLVDLYNPAFGSQRNNTFGLLLSLRIHE